MRDNIDAMTIAPRTPAEKGGATTQGGAETVRPADLFANLRVLADEGLGADVSTSPRRWQEHDLEAMLLAARRLGVPMIIGSADKSMCFLSSVTSHAIDL